MTNTSPQLRLSAEEGQVLARTSDDVGLAVATCPGAHVVLEGVGPRRRGLHAAGDDVAELALPVGGPYTLSATAYDTAGRPLARQVASDVHVGDLWILAGQSNMQGAAPLDADPEPPVGVRSFGLDRRWVAAYEPLHRVWLSRNSVVTKVWHWMYADLQVDLDVEWDSQHLADSNTPQGGQGPGSWAARALYRETGVPVGLLPCALGGSALDLWQPDWAERVGMPPADSMFANLVELAGRCGPVRGVLWYQGETDALHEGTTYAERFSGFVTAVRAAVANADLPFITVQLGLYDAEMLAKQTNGGAPDFSPGWAEIREQQRRAAIEIPGVHMVSAADLETTDGTHIDRPGVEALGERLAAVAQLYVPEGVGRPAPAVGQPSWIDPRTLRLPVTGIALPLQVTAPWAFRLERASDGVEPAQLIGLESDGAGLVLSFDAPVTSDDVVLVRNGLGRFADVHDADGFPLPAFGPLTISPADARRDATMPQPA